MATKQEIADAFGVDVATAEAVFLIGSQKQALVAHEALTAQARVSFDRVQNMLLERRDLIEAGDKTAITTPLTMADVVAKFAE